VGSFDDPNLFEPEMQVCMESAVTWLNIHDDVPRYSQKPEGMTPLIDYDPVTGGIGQPRTQDSDHQKQASEGFESREEGPIA
jgi:hypothetical protein